MEKSLICILSLVLLGGCAGSEYAIEPMINAAGQSVVPIADASTLKEMAVHETLQTNVEYYYQAATAAGLTMSYQPVTLSDGSQTFLPRVSWTPPPKLITGLPVEPSRHPVWDTIDTGIKTITPWAAGYFISDSLFGAFEGMSNNAGQHYYGPAQVSGSYNSAGNDQSITTGLLDQSHDNQIATPEDGPDDGQFIDNNGQCWMLDDPGCSCESRANGHC